MDLVGPMALTRYGHRLQRALIPVFPRLSDCLPDSSHPHWLSTPSASQQTSSDVLSSLLIQPRFAIIMRWVVLALFMIGFHFDLLAS